MCHFCERSARGKGPGRDDRIVSSCDNRTDPCAGRASDRSHERGIAPNDVPDRRQTPDGRTTLRASARERPTGARPDTRLRDRSSGSLPIVHGANSVDHVRARYPGSTGFDRLPRPARAQRDRRHRPDRSGIPLGSQLMAERDRAGCLDDCPCIRRSRHRPAATAGTLP